MANSSREFCGDNPQGNQNCARIRNSRQIARFRLPPNASEHSHTHDPPRNSHMLQLANARHDNPHEPTSRYGQRGQNAHAPPLLHNLPALRRDSKGILTNFWRNFVRITNLGGGPLPTPIRPVRASCNRIIGPHGPRLHGVLPSASQIRRTDTPSHVGRATPPGGIER